MKRSLNILALIVSASFCLQASALALTVTNTNDSGAGSLRQALAAANDGDRINFDSSLNGQTITLTSGQLVVGSSVTVSGPGANQLTVQRSTDVGTPDFRIFYISSGKTVTISGLTITNGHPLPDDSGGGIYNDDATLTVSNCTLNGNSAHQGGGIYNGGAATVTHSTISGNSAGSAGGGISNGGTFSSATLTVTNCTLSGNSAGIFGGSIFNTHEQNLGATIMIGYTILNAGTPGNIYLFSGTVTSLGHNLSSDDASAILNATGDQNSTDPLLGQLLNNGGPTLTHLPSPLSPAVDAGPLFEEQRGFSRVVNDRIDIGAVEVQSSPTPTPTPDTDGYTDPSADACSADGIRRHPEDCQQLHCELEQRKRCDRLPAGRLHEQYLCQLRAGVPGSGCRECHQSKRYRTGCEYVLLLPGARLQRQRHEPKF